MTRGVRKVLVEVNNLTKKFDGFVAVDNIKCQIFKGEILGLLGPNGAGKTTIVRMITTLTNPTSGNISFDGINVGEKTLEVRKRLGIVPQELAVYNNLTIKENLEYIGKMYNVRKNKLKRKIEELLSQFYLKDKRNTLVKKLSGGEKRKLNFMLAIVHEPDLVILDEPTVGFDPNARRNAWEMIGRLKEAGVTILITTHYMEEADFLCDRVLMIDVGKIIVEGTPQELKTLFGKEVIISFTVDSNAAKKITNSIKEGNLASDVNFDGKNLKIICRVDNKHKVVKRIYDLGVLFSEMRVIEPTLDDVFMKFTGKRLRED